MKLPKPKWREFDRKQRALGAIDGGRRSWPSRLKGMFRGIDPDRAQVVAELMAKLVGETVKSKILRAILMGAIAAGTQLVQTDPEANVAPPPAVYQQAPAPESE